MVAIGEGEGVRFEPAAFLILVAAISTSFYFVLQKPYLKKYSPLKFAAYAIWSGTFFQLFFSRGLMQNIKTAPIEATLAIIYMGIFPAALAYITWAYVLSRIPASLAGIYLYLSPVLAILIAWIWLGEIPYVNLSWEKAAVAITTGLPGKIIPILFHNFKALFEKEATEIKELVST